MRNEHAAFHFRPPARLDQRKLQLYIHLQLQFNMQARVEEAADDVRGLRSEVGRLTERLLAEERKV